MQYYELIFPKQKSPIKNIFTYHSKVELSKGDLVSAKLRNKIYQGIVLNQVEKPEFKTNEVLEVIIKNLIQDYQIDLFYYIKEYYSANSSRTINLFTPKKIEKLTQEIYDSLEEVPEEIKATPPKFELNETQKEILDFLHKDENKIHLIHGITGSGKTIIYLKRAEEILKQGKQVLILIPEISLTPQTIKIFKDYFGKESISVYHSKLNQSEQLKEWLRIRHNKSKIIIGSRSTLFLPYTNLGLIIMDEEHDHAYKQEQNPRYHSRTIVQWYQKNLKIQTILGSATPSLETYAASQSGDKIVRHEILHRSQYQEMPKVKIIDLKDELKKGNFSPIAEDLQIEISQRIKKKEQVLLLHNKRGFASQIICVDCGESTHCPHCSIGLTLHKKLNKQSLICHYCDFKTSVPSNCAKCQSVQLKGIGTGTQKVYEELVKLFPTAKIKRVDSDTTSKKNAHQELYDSLKKSEFDIIIGTQMIATGLDISAISLVGVTNADIALNMPDFRASERAFQLLTQVSGRTGRGKQEGKVIIQTFNPNHPVLNAVKNHDIKNFFKEELTFRKKFNYPPYARLTKLTFSHKNQTTVKKEVSRIEQLLHFHKLSFKSAPALIEKRNDKFYHHILINHLNPNPYLKSLGLSPDWWIDRDPINTI
jgi:primosomal protein N' (replication factor Y)